MKKFKYRLQKIADTKEKQVKQKSSELAELYLQKEEKVKRFNTLQNELGEVQKEIIQKTLNGCSAKDLLDRQRYVEKLNQDLKSERKKIEEIDTRIEELKTVLLHLNREKKVLNKLREKRYLQYLQEQTREEQKLLDEIFLLTKEFRQVL